MSNKQKPGKSRIRDTTNLQIENSIIKKSNAENTNIRKRYTNNPILKSKIKTAVVKWDKGKIDSICQSENPAKELVIAMKDYTERASKCKSSIIVFPAFTGCLYQLLILESLFTHNEILYSMVKNNTLADRLAKISTSKFINNGGYPSQSNFLNEIASISKVYNITVCPGSYWSIDRDRDSDSDSDSDSDKVKVFHESCLISNGNIILKQQQIYLARWEREIGLSRGKDTGLVNILNVWKVGIVLSTDVFYPALSRKLALMGANIVISPVGFVGKKNPALQISGMWQETQQNLFFTLESGFNGNLGERELWGESIVHGPLEMTKNDDGILAKTKDKEDFLVCELDNGLRMAAIARFNVLKSLNPELYANYRYI